MRLNVWPRRRDLRSVEPSSTRASERSRMRKAGPPIDVIVGSSLTMVSQLARTQSFHFGEVVKWTDEKRGALAAGKWAMHVNCAWRFIDGMTIVTGMDDHFLTEPADGSTELKHRLAAWLPRWSIGDREVHEPERFAVVSVATNRYHDVDIEFAQGARLQLFPDGSSENWRLFAVNDESPHLVIESGQIRESD